MAGRGRWRRRAVRPVAADFIAELPQGYRTGVSQAPPSSWRLSLAVDRPASQPVARHVLGSTATPAPLLRRLAGAPVPRPPQGRLCPLPPEGRLQPCYLGRTCGNT